MGKKAQRAAKILRQQELVNTAKTANRSLNGEEQAEFDSHPGSTPFGKRGQQETPPQSTGSDADEE